MTNSRVFPMVKLLLGILMLLAPSCLAAAEFAIRLNEVSLSAPNQRITIGDIAEIVGGTPSQREHISDLDLETLGRNAKVCHITRRQIELRVMVDGYTRRQFEVIGPSEVTVHSSVSKELRGRLEELITGEICRQFAVDENAVAVRLVNEQQIKSVETKLVCDEFSATVLFQPQLPIGKTQIQIEFEKPGGIRFLEEFDSQVIISMEVALATQGIPGGTTIDQDMIQVIKRPILSKEDFAEPDQVIGRVAKRDIASNEVVLNSAIAKPATNREPIVKRNDLLDVIVKMGQNEIRLKNAKALSQGNAGDSIVVLNTRSNKQLNATVVNRNLAMVAPLLGGLR